MDCLLLSVSYLAALWVRAPVHPGDIVRWALDGDLPYLGASAEVRRRLLEARKRGAAVVLISEDLDEVLALSDRILVMHDGQLTQAKTRDRATIGLLMAGTAT